MHRAGTRHRSTLLQLNQGHRNAQRIFSTMIDHREEVTPTVWDTQTMSLRGIPIHRTGEGRTRMNGARQKMVDGVNLLKQEGNRGVGIPALKGSQVEISKHL
jgi:hypothetical protein